LALQSTEDYMIKHYLQGLLMGSADIVPGVSGGTMALIVGIYERLIRSISLVFSAIAKGLRGRIGDARQDLREVDWRLIVPLGLGIITAIALGAQIIPVLLERYPMQSRGLFLGLVTGSILIPWLRLKRVSGKHVLLAVVAGVIAFTLVGLPPREVLNPSLVYVFGAAAVAICAMILPGVSGSFLLEAFGIYRATLNAINPLRETFSVVYITVFILGAAVGMGLFSKLLSYLLEHRHDMTMAALIGVMAGSLRALWPYQAEDRTLLAPAEGDPVLSVALLALVGLVLIVLLTLWGHRRIEDTPGRFPQPES
jgi:putative membrane protein